MEHLQRREFNGTDTEDSSAAIGAGAGVGGFLFVVVIGNSHFYSVTLCLWPLASHELAVPTSVRVTKFVTPCLE